MRLSWDIGFWSIKKCLAYKAGLAALSSEDLLLRPPCEIVVRYVLPAFRSMVAKELIGEYGFTQVAAAKKLGTTQAAISYYLDAKRGGKRLKQLESNPAIQVAITVIAKGIANDHLKPEESMAEFCSLCNDLRKQGVICMIHRDSVSLPQSCDICPRTSRKQPQMGLPATSATNLPTNQPAAGKLQ